MNTQQAVTFAIETIRTAKQSMIENGVSDPKMVYAVCNKLAAILAIDITVVIEIMEVV